MNPGSNSISTASALLFAVLAGCGSNDHNWKLNAAPAASAPVAPAAPATSYLPVGPQTNVAESTVTAGGWTVCATDPYDGTTVVITTVLATCNKARLMLACRPV